MTDRERFEAWASETWMCDCQFDATRNCYIEFPVHMAWKGWQASRKQALGDAAYACLRHAIAWGDTTSVSRSHADMSQGAMQCSETVSALANPEGQP